MPNPVAGELILLLLAVVFEKACDLAHRVVLDCPAPGRALLVRGSTLAPQVAAIGRARARDPIAFYSAACSVRKRSISCSARRYSTGITLTKRVRMVAQSSRIALARAEPV